MNEQCARAVLLLLTTVAAATAGGCQEQPESTHSTDSKNKESQSRAALSVSDAAPSSADLPDASRTSSESPGDPINPWTGPIGQVTGLDTLNAWGTKANVIAIVRCSQAYTREIAGPPYAMTTYTIDQMEVIKGTAPLPPTVDAAGGTLRDYDVLDSSTPRLQEGHQYLLFLVQGRRGYKILAAPELSNNAGFWIVDRYMSLSEVRSQIAIFNTL